MAIQTQYPYIDEEQVIHNELIRTYSDIGANLIQVETAIEYGDSVIDTYPSRYTYIEKPFDSTDEAKD